MLITFLFLFEFFFIDSISSGVGFDEVVSHLVYTIPLSCYTRRHYANLITLVGDYSGFVQSYPKFYLTDEIYKKL